ncbi:hypothetical protein Tco_0854581 [Tanacetum coccineum]
MLPPPPPLETIRQWFPTIRYGEAVEAKGTLKKSLLPPRWRLLVAQIINCLGGKIEGFDQLTNKDAIILYSLANRALKKNQPEGPPFTDHMLAIFKAYMPVEHKAPNTSSYTRKKDSKGKKPGAKSRHRKQPTSYKHHPLSKIKATNGGPSKEPIGSKTSHLVKETQSTSALDTNPSQPPASTPVVARLYKEDQQAAGGPISLGVTISTIIHSESTSEHDVLAKSKAGADFGLSAPKDSISQTTCNDEGPNKLSPDHISASTNPHVLVKKTKSMSEWLETVLTQPTIGKGASDIAKKIDEGEEEDGEIHATKHNETEDTLAPQPPSLSSLPTKLKELPSKFNDLTKEVNGLKKHVHELEIKLTRDLKVIPNKLETFTSTIKSLTTQVAGLKTLYFLHLQHKRLEILVFLQHAKLALNLLRGKRTQIKSPSLIPQRAPLSLKGEHIKKDKGKKVMSLKDSKEKGSESDFDNTIHLTGSMVESSKKKKLKEFHFVTKGGDHVHLTKEKIKAQKRIKESAKVKVAKHEVQVRKEELVDLLGPDVVSKYYKAKLQYDNCDKILNRKASSKITNYDVLTRKSPITLKVYREDETSKVIPNIKASDLHLGEWRETRMDYLHETEAELGIDLDKPLSEQDPLKKLNDLAKKKRNNADDIHDYLEQTKGSSYQQDFVTIKDVKDFPNEIFTLYKKFVDPNE